MYAGERKLGFVAGAFLAGFVLATAGMTTANAQQSQTPTVSAFLANPGLLLQQNPNGGTKLANAVQQLALLDPTTFKVLLGLLANANDLQKGAIGEGLAQAAKVEVLTNQAIAADWQQQIAAVTDPAFKTAALNAFGDVRLGAVGGGAGGLGAAGAGLGGPGGGPGGGGGGGPQDIRSAPTSTQSFTTSASTSGASGSSGSSAGSSASQ
jgi:hypothetical protein